MNHNNDSCMIREMLSERVRHIESMAQWICYLAKHYQCYVSAMTVRYL